MTPPIVSFVGRSDSGKTTLLEKLIPELKRRGYVVGTVKHDAHSFEIDRPGKDSARHTAAGAAVMVISSASQTAMVRRTEEGLSLDEIAQNYMGSVDIILTEGFKREGKPKIELLTAGEDLLSPADDLVLIVVPEESESVRLGGRGAKDIPVCHRDDIPAIADLLEKEFLRVEDEAGGIELFVDGREIPLNRIMRAMVDSTVRGLISSLKGVDDPRSVTVRVRRRERDTLEN